MSNIYCVMHRLVMEDGFDCSLTELSLNHPAAVETRNKVMAAGVIGTQSDSLLAQLFDVRNYFLFLVRLPSINYCIFPQ